MISSLRETGWGPARGPRLRRSAGLYRIRVRRQGSCKKALQMRQEETILRDMSIVYPLYPRVNVVSMHYIIAG